MTTIGESVSRVRNTLKAVKEDPFLTDRAIYYCILKYAKTLIKREDNQMRLMRMSSIFSVLPYSTTYKYNKKVYFWYLNGYIYVPNADWDAIRMELVLEDNVVNCDPANECTLRQEQSFNLPEYLFSEAEQYAIKELTMTLSVPTDGADDGQNAFR